MKKEITLGQVLAVAVTIIIALATGWITTQKKIAVTEQRVLSLELQTAEDKIYYRKSIDELKWQVADGNQKIGEKLTDILVKLENKANRK